MALTIYIHSGKLPEHFKYTFYIFWYSWPVKSWKAELYGCYYLWFNMLAQKILPSFLCYFHPLYMCNPLSINLSGWWGAIDSLTAITSYLRCSSDVAEEIIHLRIINTIWHTWSSRNFECPRQLLVRDPARGGMILFDEQQREIATSAGRYI